MDLFAAPVGSKSARVTVKNGKVAIVGFDHGVRIDGSARILWSGCIF